MPWLCWASLASHADSAGSVVQAAPHALAWLSPVWCAGCPPCPDLAVLTQPCVVCRLPPMPWPGCADSALCGVQAAPHALAWLC